SVRNGQAGLVGDVTSGVFREIFQILAAVPKAFMTAGQENKTPDKPRQMSDSESQALKLIEAKSTKLGLKANIRLWSMSPSKVQAEQHVQEFISTLQQFTLSNLNAFRLGRRIFNKAGFKQDFKLRRVRPGQLILNTEELASIYHLPNATVETP